MMISVETNIIQVVMLAARANALLRVRRLRRIIGTLHLPQKNRHKLVHPRIFREQQIRRIRH